MPPMRSFLIALPLFWGLLLAPSAEALPLGGISDPSSQPASAKLRGGKAIAPRSAPRAVRGVIRAANRIRRKPYLWGGGHGMWGNNWPVQDGYDCSGSVSYALWGGGLVRRTRTSGDYMSWGKRGRGNWITIWANEEHVYMTVAGLRWDTSGGRGPRWHKDRASTKGFRARHPAGF